MTTVLDRIKAYKLDEIASRKAARPQAEIETAARAAPRVRPFAEALQKAGRPQPDIEAAARSGPKVRRFGEALQKASREGYGLIAEVKKASPSKGLIRDPFEPEAIAEAYEAGGAACLSVLTDAPSFQGHEDYLRAARGSCALPVLRKDFLFDPWQVAESRAMGADCILIIMAAVDDTLAQELHDAATQWGMDVLIEVHDEDQLDRAQRLPSALIGVNNRDLRSFETSLDVTRRLSRLVAADRTIVSESGLSTSDDLADLARFGARCFLIGESLMRQSDVADATRTILSDPLTASGRI